MDLYIPDSFNEDVVVGEIYREDDDIASQPIIQDEVA